ncbi:unnamed protein product [Clavelina lepadiformis]|uniref:Uncharacterized protein n=1 Tax=Clavelina lepadiformis TaxID=159417 RepID=A0ABP0GGF4_CLALP
MNKTDTTTEDERKLYDICFFRWHSFNCIGLLPVQVRGLSTCWMEVGSSATDTEDNPGFSALLAPVKQKVVQYKGDSYEFHTMFSLTPFLPQNIQMFYRYKHERGGTVADFKTCKDFPQSWTVFDLISSDFI